MKYKRGFVMSIVPIPKPVSPFSILQKEAVISNSKSIAIGSFGPCYVLTGHDPKTKFTFAAHLDDNTQVESVSEVFKKLEGLGVDLNDLTEVCLMGGWKGHAESAKWGGKIIKLLEEHGLLAKVNFDLFQKKMARDPSFMTDDLSVAAQFYFNGGMLNPTDGKFKLFEKTWLKLEKRQIQANEDLTSNLLQDFIKSHPGMSPLEINLRVGQIFQAFEQPLKVTVIADVIPLS